MLNLDGGEISHIVFRICIYRYHSQTMKKGVLFFLRRAFPLKSKQSKVRHEKYSVHLIAALPTPKCVHQSVRFYDFPNYKSHCIIKSLPSKHYDCSSVFISTL